MFPEMRRIKQQLSDQAAEAVLLRGTSGVLSLLGEDGYPYGVPLSYVYQNGKLLFHCATKGHKLDALRREEKCSFCVIDQDEIAPERYTTRYRSVIAFGTAKILEDPTQKRAAIEALATRFNPHDPAGREQEIRDSWDHFCLVEMTIVHMTGKQSKELAQEEGSL